MGIDHLGLFLLAGILLNLTPGPDVLYIVAQSAKRGLRAGVAAALGIVAGCFVHIAAAALGVSALIAASTTAFTALKWLGAAYLVWIGWGMIKPHVAINIEASGEENLRATGQIGLKKVFVIGFWTNVLNPKVALFFLAFLPQFISPQVGDKTLAFVLLGLMFNLNSLWVNLAYAWLGASVGEALGAVASPRWHKLQGQLQWVERLAGALFIAFGLKLALTDNPA